MKWITSQWKLGKVTKTVWRRTRLLLKRRLRTTVRVQKIRARKGKAGCIAPAAIKGLLNCNTCKRTAARIRRQLKGNKKGRKGMKKKVHKPLKKKAAKKAKKAQTGSKQTSGSNATA